MTTLAALVVALGAATASAQPLGSFTWQLQPYCNRVTVNVVQTGAVGVTDINPAEVQRRVVTACPAGQLMKSVNQDGTAVCEAVTGTADGDITSVTAGAGLTGGGVTGDVALAVNFAGPGAAAMAARSGHDHTAGIDNTRIGSSALAANTTGNQNTAIGRRAGHCSAPWDRAIERSGEG